MMKMAGINKQEIIEKLARRHGTEGIEQQYFFEDVVDEVISYYLAIANNISAEDIKEVPEDHSFIIRGVASKQYNRRGSEGLEQEQVDGYRAKYVKNDFDEYMSFIEAKCMPEEDDDEAGKGKLVFF